MSRRLANVAAISYFFVVPALGGFAMSQGWVPQWGIAVILISLLVVFGWAWSRDPKRDQ